MTTIPSSIETPDTRDASAHRLPGRLGGMGADAVTLDVALVHGRELSMTGVFRYANTYPLALQLISSGAVNVTDVITTASLSKTPNAP